MKPLQTILSDSLLSSRRGFEITFYSQSVRHTPPVAAVERHAGTSTSPGRRISNALSKQLDILFIIHKLRFNKCASSVYFYFMYHPVIFTIYFIHCS